MLKTTKFQRKSYKQSFYILINDFITLLSYIEACDNNLGTYSHRLYELFLRASTEFESICKDLLIMSNYPERTFEDWNITDYHTLSSPRGLSRYTLMFDTWNPTSKIIVPLKEWSNVEYKPLSWYQDYNEVKHNRNMNFELASFNNTILAIGSVFVILYSELNEDIFSQFQENTAYNTDSEAFKYSLTGNIPFSIKKL